MEAPIVHLTSLEEADPDLEVEFSQYDPPEVLQNLPDVQSQVILAIVQSSLANVKEQIAHEDALRRAAAEEEQRIAQAAVEAEAAEGKGKEKAEVNLEVPPTVEAPAGPSMVIDVPSIQILPPADSERRQKRRFGRITRLIRHGRESRAETSSAGAVRALAEGSLDAHLNTRVYLSHKKSKELPKIEPDKADKPDTVYAFRPLLFFSDVLN
jgi:hypothetical protein